MDAGKKLQGTPEVFDVTDLGPDSKIGWTVKT